MTGYLAKHWRGRLPLAQSFGLSALALTPFILWSVLAGNYALAHRAVSAATLILSVVPPFILFVLADIWSALGIWRCASRHNKFGRPIAAWAARSAQAAVIANFVMLALVSVLLAREWRALSAEPPRARAEYDVTLRGDTAVFRGRLSAAAAGELELLLSDKSVTRLALADSSGGDVARAAPLARLVRARKLFVVALAHCDTACALLLGAGNVRAVAPTSMLDFGAGKPERSLRSLIEQQIVTTIFDARTKRYVWARRWCARQPVACARTGRQNSAARQR